MTFYIAITIGLFVALTLTCVGSLVPVLRDRLRGVR
jgi:hypothetical protein